MVGTVRPPCPSLRRCPCEQQGLSPLTGDTADTVEKRTSFSMRRPVMPEHDAGIFG